MSFIDFGSIVIICGERGVLSLGRLDRSGREKWWRDFFVLLGLISAGCDKVESMEFRSMATGAVDFIV